MDIELNEPKALQGFDIERFKPALVCVEGLLPVRQRILDYFAEHHYVVIGKYIWVDRENFYLIHATRVVACHPLEACTFSSRTAAVRTQAGRQNCFWECRPQAVAP